MWSESTVLCPHNLGDDSSSPETLTLSYAGNSQRRLLMWNGNLSVLSRQERRVNGLLWNRIDNLAMIALPFSLVLPRSSLLPCPSPRVAAPFAHIESLRIRRRKGEHPWRSRQRRPRTRATLSRQSEQVALWIRDFHEATAAPREPHELRPLGIHRQRFSGPHNKQPVSRAGKGHVHAPHVRKETDPARSCGADGGHNDHVLFSSLEGVDRADLYFFLPGES